MREIGKKIRCPTFEEKIKEDLHEVTKGFEASDEIKERITERNKKAETDKGIRLWCGALRGYGLHTGVRHRFPGYQHGRHGRPGSGKAG